MILLNPRHAPTGVATVANDTSGYWDVIADRFAPEDAQRKTWLDAQVCPGVHEHDAGGATRQGDPERLSTGQPTRREPYASRRARGVKAIAA